MVLREVENALVGALQGDIRAGEPLKFHTTWRIGGPAELMVFPSGLADLKTTLQLAYEKDIPVTILGNGSNVLVSDQGIRGIVIKTSQFMQEINFNGQEIYAAAGALVPTVAKMSIERGLAGFEWASGIPASIGGATAMNAGAHGSSMSMVVAEVDALRPDGAPIHVTADQAEFEYRSSIFKTKGYLITGVKIRLQEDHNDNLQAKAHLFLARRRETQPVGANAGSVFRNPPGGPAAGYLLEKAGCKGLQVGDAFISDKHANFIINRGEASAAQVMELIHKARAMVKKNYNIDLEPEIQLLGEGN